MFISLGSIGVQAKLIKDEHSLTGQNLYTWEEVCQNLTKRDSPLIERVNAGMLDCMGKKVKPISFCEKKEITNPYLTRAIVLKNRKVACKSGRRVVLKWECEGKSDRYCQDQEVGCFLFKELLASRLKLAHHSLTGGQLNCYFDTQANAIPLNI